MLQPTVGELLGGVHRALTNEVLPEIPSGVAQRQLKAALVILRRLEHAWDRGPSYLEAEAADITATLRRVLSDGDVGDGDAEATALSERLPAVSPTAADDAPSAVAARDTELQTLLIDTEAYLRTRTDPDATSALADLRALYGRMLRRQDDAWATAPGA